MKKRRAYFPKHADMQVSKPALKIPDHVPTLLAVLAAKNAAKDKIDGLNNWRMLKCIEEFKFYETEKECTLVTVWADRKSCDRYYSYITSAALDVQSYGFLPGQGKKLNLQHCTYA